MKDGRQMDPLSHHSRSLRAGVSRIPRQLWSIPAMAKNPSELRSNCWVRLTMSLSHQIWWTWTVTGSWWISARLSPFDPISRKPGSGISSLWSKSFSVLFCCIAFSFVSDGGQGGRRGVTEAAMGCFGSNQTKFRCVYSTGFSSWLDWITSHWLAVGFDWTYCSTVKLRRVKLIATDLIGSISIELSSSSGEWQQSGLELPHTVTTWESRAVCVSEAYGFGMATGTSIEAFQPFFVELHMPYAAKRTEKLQVGSNHYNNSFHRGYCCVIPSLNSGFWWVSPGRIVGESVGLQLRRWRLAGAIDTGTFRSVSADRRTVGAAVHPRQRQRRPSLHHRRRSAGNAQRHHIGRHRWRISRSMRTWIHTFRQVWFRQSTWSILNYSDWYLTSMLFPVD